MERPLLLAHGGLKRGTVAAPERVEHPPFLGEVREPNWPKRTQQFGYAFANQFELPVLFYVLTILEYITHLAGVAFVVLAWIFVIFRVLHAFVHVTSNIVRLRGALFAISAMVLAVMWAIYIVQVLIVH